MVRDTCRQNLMFGDTSISDDSDDTRGLVFKNASNRKGCVRYYWNRKAKGERTQKAKAFCPHYPRNIGVLDVKLLRRLTRMGHHGGAPT